MKHDRPDDPTSFLFGGPQLDEARAGHLDDERLAALLEIETLEQADPGAVDHLARCDACRREWIRLRRELAAVEPAEALAPAPWELERAAQGRAPATAAPARARTARLGRWLAPAAAVLILAGVAVLVPWERLFAPQVLRSETAVNALEPLAPRGEIPSGKPLVFRWSAVTGATAYEVVVADASTGGTVLRLRARETSRELSEREAAALEPGREYRWLVRAEQGVGRSTTGVPASFRLRP